MTPEQSALVQLGTVLRRQGYRFVAPTPLTYGRVLDRERPAGADALLEAFGWNRPFRPGELPEDCHRLLEDARALQAFPDGRLRSLVRFSTLGDLLFAHSAYPTDQADAVFFGPDTYRFAQAIRRIAELEPGFSPKTVADVGAGSGAGGLYATTLFPSLREPLFFDINQRALQFAEANAAINELPARVLASDVLAAAPAALDLIISNPPYLLDAAQRTYRHGGGSWGCDLSVRIVEEALDHLTPGGRLLLYTGTPVVRGEDQFLKAVRPLLERRTQRYRYEEGDPDVFGEELENAPYDQADRIATATLYVKGSDLTW